LDQRKKIEQKALGLSSPQRRRPQRPFRATVKKITSPGIEPKGSHRCPLHNRFPAPKGSIDLPWGRPNEVARGRAQGNVLLVDVRLARTNKKTAVERFFPRRPRPHYRVFDPSAAGRIPPRARSDRWVFFPCRSRPAIRSQIHDLNVHGAALFAGPAPSQRAFGLCAHLRRRVYGWPWKAARSKIIHTEKLKWINRPPNDPRGFDEISGSLVFCFLWVVGPIFARLSGVRG